ncbi:TonB-dependent receptor domain-containing protein [Chitinophaga niastensis]|uniref:TonB-dependent receptor domain-containing protein n=1 Tax=Chitinophaga niastensis TaxID=536980 RepID=UPI001304F11C|nr:TonB-dependent receptor [Chitinophaga niastensis]
MSVFIIVFLLSTVNTVAQISISGRIVEKEEKGISFASVECQEDSTVLCVAVSDEQGYYHLICNTSFPRMMIIKVSRIGFVKKQRVIEPGRDLKDTVLGNIILIRDSTTTLTGVTVKAQRPLFEKKSDRFVFNLNGNPLLSGNNAWDILRHVPLVSANDLGALFIAGKKNTVVYINGRKNLMGQEALYYLLKNMPADNIAKVEVITNPSSLFDAGDGAGIINIVLKKPDTDGLQGRVSVTDEQAAYNTQRTFNNISYRHGKIGASLNVWGNRMKHLRTEHTAVLYKKNNDENLNDITRIQPKNFYGGTLQLNYDINAKQTAGLIINTINNDQHHRDFTSTLYRQKGSDHVDSSLQTQTLSQLKGHSTNINFNYQFNIDSLGGYLSVDVDYFNYYDFIQQENKIRTNNNFISRLPQKIDNLSWKIDYKYAFNENTDITAGIKYFNTKSDNNLFFGLWNTDTYKQDSTRSNHYRYQEQINAAFASLRKKWNSKWETTVGLRAENTNIEGVTVNLNQSFRKKYWSVFPSLFINFTPAANHQFAYSITNHIGRPDFNILNPFRFYTSADIYAEGNPFLQAAKVITQELSYTLSGKYVFLLNHKFSRDDYDQFIITDSGNNTMKYQYFNFGQSNDYTLTSSIAQSFCNGIIESNFSFTLGYRKYQGAVPGQYINRGAMYGSAYLDNTIYISKEKKLTGYVVFSYNTPQETSMGKAGQSAALEISIRKKIKQFTFTLFSIDLLNTSVPSTVFDNDYSHNRIKQGNDTRVLGMVVSYGFGNKKMKTVKSRNTSNQEIIDRSSH